VEDNASVREVLELFFQNASYDVQHAPTGAEALVALESGGFAAVVLDYRLPDCTGLDVLAAIKSRWPSLPVVMITGCGSEHVCASALKLGVRDYFSKPFNAFDLICSVRRILSGASRAGEHRENVLGNELWERHEGSTASMRHDLTIQQAMMLIQQRYWDVLSLSKLAHELRMSKYHLSRRFREVSGVTFREYLLAIRIEKAKELLPAKHLTVTQVAQTVGFSDLPRFDKLFKRSTGESPSTYRAQALA
jgi:YesN/AraC family two-component response regulator